MAQTEQPRWSRRSRELLPPSEDRVVLLAVGDTVLNASFYYSSPEPTRTLMGLLRDADLTMATLSTTLTDSGAPEPKDAFLAPAIVSDDLAGAGVDLVSLATNHFSDSGPSGVAQTLAALRRTNIEAIGAGENLEAARRASIRTVKGVRVATLACHTAVNWDRPVGSLAAGPASPGVAPVRARQVRSGLAAGTAAILPFDPDLRDLENAIRQARRNADIVTLLVDVQWPDGTIGLTAPPAGVRLIARSAAEAGADLVFGTGALRMGPIETIKNTWVFYGLGSFALQLFGPNGPDGRFGLFPETEAKIRRWQKDPACFASIAVRPAIEKTKIARIDIVPFVLGPAGVPRVATDAEAARVLGDLKTASQGLGASLAIEGWRGSLALTQES